MRLRKWTKRLGALAVAALLLTGGVVYAQGGYALSWWTVDGGGGPLSNGTYALSATAGQPDAGTLSSGTYTLRGGFWVFANDGGVTPPSGNKLYLPFVVK